MEALHKPNNIFGVSGRQCDVSRLDVTQYDASREAVSCCRVRPKCIKHKHTKMRSDSKPATSGGNGRFQSTIQVAISPLFSWRLCFTCTIREYVMKATDFWKTAKSSAYS